MVTPAKLIWITPDAEALIAQIARGNGATGKAVGSPKGKGYLRVHVEGRSYAVHRLIWLMHTGAWPKDQLDHINRVRTDNRIENLRVHLPTVFEAAGL